MYDELLDGYAVSRFSSQRNFVESSFPSGMISNGMGLGIGAFSMYLTRLPLDEVGAPNRWERSAAVAAADVDIHNCMCIAMEKAKEYGYKRPGLAVKSTTAERGNHTWESAFFYEQRMFLKKNRIPVFWSEVEEMTGMLEWYERYQPDVIIGHEPPSLSYLRREGIRVPEDVGYIALEEHNPDWNLSCVNIHPRTIGSAAVDLVLERIRDGIKGEPEIPKTVLIDGHWVDGGTLLGQDS